MMTQQISFSQLENVLLGLGFEETRVRGSHVRFDNPRADAVILLSDREGTVTPNHFRMVGKVLEGKGVKEREDFERLFRQPQAFRSRQTDNPANRSAAEIIRK